MKDLTCSFSSIYWSLGGCGGQLFVFSYPYQKYSSSMSQHPYLRRYFSVPKLRKRKETSYSIISILECDLQELLFASTSELNNRAQMDILVDKNIDIKMHITYHTYSYRYSQDQVFSSWLSRLQFCIDCGLGNKST